MSELINQNASYSDSASMDTLAEFFIESYDTDFTEEDYSVRKAALLNTSLYIINPAEYYVPYGEYTEDGGFVISDNSLTTITQKTAKSE